MKKLALLLLFVSTSLLGQKASKEEWISMFNGKDLTGWTPKIRTMLLVKTLETPFVWKMVSLW